MDTVIEFQKIWHEDDFKSNSTCNSPTLKTVQRLESVLNGLTLTFILPLTTVVLFTMLLSHKLTKHTTTSPYLTTLFISDFLHSWTVLLLTLNRESITHLNQALCQCILFIYNASCTYSLCMLAVISTIRYRILHRRTLNNKQTTNVKRNIGVLFVSSAMCAIPAVLFVQIHRKKGNYGICQIYLPTQKAYELFLGIKIVFCFLWGVFPTVIFSYFYAIFCKALRNMTHNKHNKTLYFINILILSFLCIQIPYLIIMFMEIFFLYVAKTSCQEIIRKDILQSVVRLIPEIHCLSNPLVYAFTRTDFRQRLYTFLKCNLCCKSSVDTGKNNEI
ncbi:U12 protein [macacine betaherpesvirus 9]|uniref:U12 protein n=1 Tax=macacine betaherpesvirus 9 TaxID=2560568 RepID=A0A191S3U8_9BETA|nr:U12 protein [macacine betaherpesvirus 9]ANC96558.1 U12 protein [macacine betaherpesvirus 9]